MGQKVIPISLRLKKHKNWNSKWIVNQEHLCTVTDQHNSDIDATRRRK